MGGPETGLLIAGTLTSAIGSLKQAQSTKSAAKFNAAQSRANAAGARLAATEKAKREERLSRKRMGGLRARGVSLDLLADNAMENKLAELTTLHAGELRAQGFEGTAAADDLLASNTSGLGEAASTLLVGGAAAHKSHREGN